MDNSRHLKEFGARVERARMRLVGLAGRKVGQQDIADALGVAQSTYGRWENGLKEPAMDTVMRLAELLGVTPEWLAFGRGEMASAEPPRFLAAQEGAETKTPPQAEAAPWLQAPMLPPQRAEAPPEAKPRTKRRPA